MSRTDSFQKRLSLQAQAIRKQAGKLKPGPARDALLQKAGQIDTTARVNAWLSSSRLAQPK